MPEIETWGDSIVLAQIYQRNSDMHCLIPPGFYVLGNCPGPIQIFFVQRCSLNVPGILAHLYITAGIL